MIDFLQTRFQMLYHPNQRRFVFTFLLGLAAIMTIFEWNISNKNPGILPLCLIGTALYMLLFHKFLSRNCARDKKELFKKLGDLGTTAGIIEISIILLSKIVEQI